MTRPPTVPHDLRRRTPTFRTARSRAPALAASRLGARTVAVLVITTLCAAAGAPTGSASAPAPAGAAEYVALGDSYSSGTGTGQYVDEGCRRSAAAFPARVAASLPGTTLTSMACSGATIPDVERDQLTALTPATTVVTLTIGGNDAGFTKVITRCALPSWIARCSPPVERARRLVRRTLPARLDRLYAAIRLRAPAATVVVAGYPRLLNGIDCGPVTFFSRGDARLLNGTADLLRDVLRSRAKAAGFRFADVVPAFDGHAVCDDPEWLNGLSAPLRESFHPNAVGHAEGYTPAILAQLAGGAS